MAKVARLELVEGAVGVEAPHGDHPPTATPSVARLSLSVLLPPDLAGFSPGVTDHLAIGREDKHQSRGNLSCRRILDGRHSRVSRVY